VTRIVTLPITPYGSLLCEVHRVWHRVSTLSPGLVIKAGGRCSSTSPRPPHQRAGAPPDLTDSSSVKPGPVPGPRHPRTTSPGWRMVRCCTAAKYSNRVDRHRLNVATNGLRRADTTPIDRPARSSGRRSRRFRSRHPDTDTARDRPVLRITERHCLH
jgi:hypothetical protein